MPSLIGNSHAARRLGFGLLWVGACAPSPAAAPTPGTLPTATRPSTTASGAPSTPPAARRPRVIVFVWDGLRPDSVSEQTTPHLARLRDHDGVNFTNHHAVYPTFTMMNAAAFATGAYPGRHGFFGNTEYQPGPTGSNGEGKAIDFTQPVFTEDHGVLQALDAFYNAGTPSSGLLKVQTLFEAAHAAGLRTAALGKIGPAFLQDYRLDPERSVILDENVALPLSFARALQSEGLALPANTEHHAYPAGQNVALAPNNGKPSAAENDKIVRLKDGVTPDPRSALGSAHDAANEYLMTVYLSYVLPKFAPDLSVVWLRNPDSTEHQFGPGSANYLDALAAQDRLLGKLQAKLLELGQSDSTDLIVVSDHGHSTVAGDEKLFPLRALQGEPNGQGEVGGVSASGYAVSGEIRTADVLQRAGFAHVYDGGGCLLDPVLSGIRKDGSLVYPTHADTTGSCTVGARVSPTGKEKRPSFSYSMASFRLPATLPKDAIVVAANGGSEYFYLLDHSQKTAEKLLRTLAERVAYGAIFLHSSYGNVPGTLPLSAIAAEGARSSPPTPDLIVSFDWNEAARAGGSAGLPGTEYASAQRYRGIHGSFSPRDVHNTLIAHGPHFKTGYTDTLPSSNVDLAPTVAALFGLNFHAPDGRVLHEALLGETVDYPVQPVTQRSDPVSLSRTCQPDDPGCLHPTAGATYRLTLYKQLLSVPGVAAPFSYLDRASVTRDR